MSEVNINLKQLIAKRNEIILISTLTFLFSLISFFYINKIWLFSVTIESQQKEYSNNNDLDLNESYEKYIQSLFSTEINKITTPEFLKEMTYKINRPDLYKSFLGREYSGQGLIRLISKTADSATFHFEINNKEIGNKIADTINDLINTEYKKYILIKNSQLIDDESKSIADIQAEIDFVDRVFAESSINFEKYKLFKIKKNLQLELNKKLIKLKNYEAIIKIIELDNNLLKLKIFNFPDPIWPNKRIFIMIGIVLMLIFNITFMLWKKIIFFKKT